MAVSGGLRVGPISSGTGRARSFLTKCVGYVNRGREGGAGVGPAVSTPAPLRPSRVEPSA